MAKATKKDKEITLETVLWNCRVALRGVGSMEKNRDAVIGLAFLKFAGDKFDKRRAELLAQYGDIPVFLEKPSFYNPVNVFYLKDTARWSYIVKNAGANDIAVILDQAMADIEEANPSLKGALLQNFYATLGAPKEKTKALIVKFHIVLKRQFFAVIGIKAILFARCPHFRFAPIEITLPFAFLSPAFYPPAGIGQPPGMFIPVHNC